MPGSVTGCFRLPHRARNPAEPSATIAGAGVCAVERRGLLERLLRAAGDDWL